MTKSSVSYTASESVIRDLLEAAGDVPDVAASKPILAESVPASYRSPFGASPDELQALLKVLSLVFSTGTAALVFVDKLVDIVRKHRQPVVLADPRNNRDQLTVEPGTPPDTIRDWIGRER